MGFSKKLFFFLVLSVLFFPFLSTPANAQDKKVKHSSDFSIFRTWVLQTKNRSFVVIIHLTFSPKKVRQLTTYLHFPKFGKPQGYKIQKQFAFFKMVPQGKNWGMIVAKRQVNFGGKAYVRWFYQQGKTGTLRLSGDQYIEDFQKGIPSKFSQIAAQLFQSVELVKQQEKLPILKKITSQNYQTFWKLRKKIYQQPYYASQIAKKGWPFFEENYRREIFQQLLVKLGFHPYHPKSFQTLIRALKKRGDPFKKKLDTSQLIRGSLALINTWIFQMYWYGPGGKTYLHQQVEITEKKLVLTIYQKRFKKKKNKERTRTLLFSLIKIVADPGKKGGLILVKLEKSPEKKKFIAWPYYRINAQQVRLGTMKKFTTKTAMEACQLPEERGEAPVYTTKKLVQIYEKLPILERVTLGEIPKMWKALRKIRSRPYYVALKKKKMTLGAVLENEIYQEVLVQLGYQPYSDHSLETLVEAIEHSKNQFRKRGKKG